MGLAAAGCLAVACDGAGGSPADDAAVPDAGPPPIAFPPLIGAEAVLEDRNPDPHVVEVELRAQWADHEIYEGLTLEMFGYNGQYPGPVLQAAVGDEVVVHFTNELWSETTVHWHGLRISDQMDGSPRIQAPVAAEGGTFTYRFVVPEAGTFWYHPHVQANEQLELGLMGPIIVRDHDDPEYDAERMIVLDDILIDTATERVAPFLRTHMEVMHGRYGNVLLTNGRADPEPSTAEQGTVERWRLLNSANARTMVLTLEGARFRVIGTDGGLLREPFQTDSLLMAVGMRYDVEVTYDASGPVRLISHVATLDDAGNVIDEPVTVYEVEVAPSARTPRAIVWPELPGTPERAVDQEVELAFDAVEDPEHGLLWRINGMGHWREPIFTFGQGQTVRMRLRNLAGPEHPFHLHGQFFTVVGEPGLRDTVLVGGGEEREIVAYLDNPGRWMAHCHILEHAELGMMAEIQIDPRE